MVNAKAEGEGRRQPRLPPEVLLAHLPDGTGSSRILAQAKVLKALRNRAFSPDFPERDFARFEVDGFHRPAADRLLLSTAGVRVGRSR
jgi:hypothetical protein